MRLLGFFFFLVQSTHSVIILLHMFASFIRIFLSSHLYLTCISPVPYLYISCVSPGTHPHLTCTSPVSYLGHTRISPIPHLYVSNLGHTRISPVPPLGHTCISPVPHLYAPHLYVFHLYLTCVSPGTHPYLTRASPGSPPCLTWCSCKIDEGVTHKAWLNRSNILFTGLDKWSLDKRVSLVNSNSSHFSIQIDQVHVADEGPYTCSFQANNKPRSTHVYLIVQGRYPGLPGALWRSPLDRTSWEADHEEKPTPAP